MKVIIKVLMHRNFQTHFFLLIIKMCYFVIILIFISKILADGNMQNFIVEVSYFDVKNSRERKCKTSVRRVLDVVFCWNFSYAY